MILIALGANLPSRYGAPEETLQAAKSRLEELGVSVLKSSDIWITAPVPVSDQPWYRNAVVAVDTSLAPLELIKILQSVEEEFGRVRTVRNAPRLLDLDIIAYNDESVDESTCIIPHPRMHERAFVLYPLRQVSPDWRHPVSGQSVDEMIIDLPEGQEIRLLDKKAA